MDESEKQAILDGYYNDIQKWMAKFPIEQLPAKLLVEIFKQLPSEDIHKLRQVCRSWYAILIAAADSLPKRRVDWLELNVTSYKRRRRSRHLEEVTLCSKRDGDLLWSFSDLSGIFNDVRASGMIFCGRIKFGSDTRVAQHLPLLLTLKDHAQFRPSRIEFQGSDMKEITEQQLIDCINSFAKDLQKLKFHDVYNVSHMSQSNTLLANLCSSLPKVFTDFRSLNITMSTMRTVIENAIRKWKNAEPRSCTLQLSVLMVESSIIRDIIWHIDGEPVNWDQRIGVGKIRHPHSGLDPHFFHIQLVTWH